jgi:hypothetical protein
MSWPLVMGCTVSKKYSCPLCREQRRNYRDLLCDKCAFVREFTVLHGREGLRQALRGHPYEVAPARASLASAASSSSLATSRITGRCNTFPGSERVMANPRFTMVKTVEPTAPPYFPGQSLPEH